MRRKITLKARPTNIQNKRKVRPRKGELDPFEENRHKRGGLSPFWKGLIIFIAVVVTIMVLLTMTCIAGFMECAREFEEHELVVMEHEMLDNWGRPEIVGKAKNDTGEELDWVTAKVKFYGTGDVVLGTSSDYYSNSLHPGETWQFDVIPWDVSFEEVVRYEICVTGN